MSAPHVGPTVAPSAGAVGPSKRRPPIRILIADDHPVVREGLSRMLEAAGGFSVVGQAEDGIEATRLVRESAPDVLLLDLAMPRHSGMDTLRDLSTDDSQCKSILLTGSLERGQMIEALQLGARGVILKGAPMKLTVKGIRTVMAGQYWIGRDGVSDLVDYFRHSQTGHRPVGPKFGLTKRELQVVAVVVAGFTNRDIAERFSISEDTVKHHLSNAFDKTGVSNRLELALFAINHHLVDADETPL